MKAVLVIDMAEDCQSCMYHTAELCQLDLHKIPRSYKDKIGKRVNCPLRPLPRKLNANDWHRMFGGTYKEREAKGYGYNACLDEILGETE